MPQFRIYNRRSDHDFGIYQAVDEDSALDALARDAGYESYSDIPTKGDLVVEEISDCK